MNVIADASVCDVENVKDKDKYLEKFRSESDRGCTALEQPCGASAIDHFNQKLDFAVTDKSVVAANVRGTDVTRAIISCQSTQARLAVLYHSFIRGGCL